MDTLPFYLFLAVHLVSLIVGMGAVIFIDIVGAMWIFRRADARFLVRVAGVTQKVIWLGWAGLVASGTGLIILKGYVDSLTAVKLFLVFMIGINGVALHFIKHAVGDVAAFRALPPVYRYHIIMATVVSQVGWWGAITIGFIHRHWQHYIPWPVSPWPAILGIASGWLAIVLVGQLWLAHHRARRR